MQSLDAGPRLDGAQHQLQDGNDSAEAAQTHDSPESVPLQTVALILPQSVYAIGPEQCLEYQQALAEQGEVAADVIQEPRLAVAVGQREDVEEPVSRVRGLEL